MSDGASRNAGLDELLKRPLVETIWRRRTHRGGRGVGLLKAGLVTYQSSQEPVPLTELEEAVLIATTGHTGLTMPDRPFQDPATGDFVMAKPNVNMAGGRPRRAGNGAGRPLFLFYTT